MARAIPCLSRNPSIGTLVFTPVNDSALFSLGDKLKNNFLAAVQPGSAVPFRRREDQPMPRDDFIRPTLAQHTVAAVRLQDQRWHLARNISASDFERSAPVGAGEIGFRPNRESGEK